VTSPPKDFDVIPGTLDLLILKTLAVESMHGWGIGQRIEQISGVFRLRLASLYPALERLQTEGFITATWKRSENNRRARYYALTKAGQRRLQDELNEWHARSMGVARILEAT
jgi:PadR family transcriptional regulator, regulatory protein PadR